VVRESVPTAFSSCPECNGTGWVTIVQGSTPYASRCDCFRQARIQNLIGKARIPARYAHCEISNFELSSLTTQSIEAAKLAAENFIEEYPHSTPFGLLFMGPQGIGKTHLSVGIIKALIRRKAVPCMFRTFPELLKEIQQSWSPVSESSEYGLLTPVLDTEVLVLDELGSMTPSNWVKDTVNYILNHRYKENKVTIFTTNYVDHKDDLATAKKGITDSLVDRIGDQMRSRLYEMCKMIVMVGKDFRREVKQADHHHFQRAKNQER
jgi:DNA replication protein DnaC